MSRLLRPTARVAVVAVVAVAIAACSAGGSSSPGGSMTVTDAWARPSTGMELAGAAYMVIANGTGVDDALVGASSNVSAKTEVHETTVGDSGMMGMQPVDSVAIPAGGTLELEPGGYHIMLIELSKELVVGDEVEITLTFEKAGQVKVTAEVKAG